MVIRTVTKQNPFNKGTRTKKLSYPITSFLEDTFKEWMSDTIFNFNNKCFVNFFDDFKVFAYLKAWVCARSHLFNLVFKYAAICKKFGFPRGLVWRYLLAISRNIWLCRAADIKEFPSPGKSVNSPWNTFLQNDWNNFAVRYLQKDGYIMELKYSIKDL